MKVNNFIILSRVFKSYGVVLIWMFSDFFLFFFFHRYYMLPGGGIMLVIMVEFSLLFQDPDSQTWFCKDWTPGQLFHKRC